MPEQTAEAFAAGLQALQSDEELEKIHRYFKLGPGEYGEGDIFMGVRMGSLFQLAKAFPQMPLAEIEKLLESPIHEMRAGACKIMALQAGAKKVTPEQRKGLYGLYVRRLDRINNWDLVDLCCIDVIGGYLFDKARDPLYELARSENLWTRRTAMLSTVYFLKKNQLDDAYALAELLLHDTEDMVNKPVGAVLRWAQGQDPARHLAFLDKHAPTMPRTTLRFAMEHLEKPVRNHYLALKKSR